jgi:hypothetical protein
VLVLGGPWGGSGGLPTRLAAVLAEAPVPVEVRPTALGPDAPLIGARVVALDQARAQLPALVSR